MSNEESKSRTAYVLAKDEAQLTWPWSISRTTGWPSAWDERVEC